MTEAWTLGRGLKRRRFRYGGSVATGVRVLFKSSTLRISAGFLQALMQHFSGRAVPGGFSQSNPTPGGVGEWVGIYSRLLNETRLSPRHASFIAAVLVAEGYAEASLQGNAVQLQFQPCATTAGMPLLPRLMPPEAA